MADYVLKDAFDAAFVAALGQAATALESEFELQQWQESTMPAHWPELTLKQRMRHLSQLLGTCLPGDYARQLPVVVALAPQFRSLAGMLFPDFVEVHGTDDPDRSLPALEQLTSSFSAEFAVRPFLQRYPERMLQQHLTWAEHPNEHVRRLASEGLRPRLPWGQDVAWLKKDPTVTLPVLEKLKNDPSEYVRRSVANHLNDISKSHPDWLLQVAARWKGKSQATDALLKHALRGLLKQGRPEAHRLFGFEIPEFVLERWEITPVELPIGNKASLHLRLQHRGESAQAYRLEYRIHFVKSSGQRSPKVFQIAEKSLQPGEVLELQRSHAFADLTTRKHYPGLHLLELQINGKVVASREFVLFVSCNAAKFADFRSMNILSVEKLGKSFGERTLFTELSFGLNLGQKVALVGHNGCGKTTLMRILAGRETHDQGNYSIRNDVRMAYLEQEPLLGESGGVSEVIFAGDAPEVQLLRRYNRLSLLAEPNAAEQQELHDLTLEIDAQNLWDYELEVKQILTELGISDLSQSVASLSGGQRKRVAIAQALVGRPELLLMDEPTNHLDLEVIEWLEHYLSTRRMTVLMITHDRYFLERVCNEIFELNRGKMYRHQGSYADFLENKTIREEIALVDAEKARNLMRKELEWMRRQPKARGTKSKARVENFYKLEEKAKGPSAHGKIELDVNGKRLGGKILELAYLRKNYGEKKILNDFSYIFTRFDRVGIVGKNGVGKSTFLNLLAGLIRPDGGSIEKGENTVVGYYTQEELQYQPGQTVIELVKARAEYIKMSDGRELSASNFLNRFLFPPRQQHDQVSKLSGGEKRRLQLLLVLMTGPNFLILDEPTNDLDLETLNVIEEFLDEFQGCLVLVSHDRYFMDRLVDHLFVFEGEGQMRDFPGNYTDYREWLKSEKSRQKEEDAEIKLQAKAPAVVAAPVKPAEPKKKPSFKEKYEYEQLEKQIAGLQAEIALLEQQLSSGNGTADEYAQWGLSLQQKRDQLDEAELRWLELAEIM